jgi:hypothetical protein
MLSKKPYIILVIAVVIFQNGYAQNGGKSESLFFPIRPGEVNYLSGTMGEIRSTHFHAGIDIKTSGISGLPVYATNHGYVSRIRVSAGGYGHVLYIQHPGGETSVYAHLLHFREDISKYVLQEQYRHESFEVNLFPEKDRFIIKRGEMIALSGNTGSSTAPHLHFEIRDDKQRPVNPLNYGFSEIKDEVAPILKSFALQTTSIDSRINHQFGRFEFPASKQGSDYYYKNPIPIYGEFSIQIYGYDRFNGANNRNGIPRIELFLDDTLKIKIAIDTFSFKDSRFVTNFYDYPVRKEQRRTYQKLYISDGNNLPFYKFHVNRGILSIKDEKLHSIKVRMTDLAGNSSELIVSVKGTKPASIVQNIVGKMRDRITTELLENYMKIRANFENNTPNHAFIYSNRMKYELLPAYVSNDQAVYLWDMRIGMPDSISMCDFSKSFDYEIMLPADTDFNFYNKVFDIKSFKHSLFDTIYLESKYTLLEDHNMEIFTVGNPAVPMANSIQINFKPKLKYLDTDKYALYYTEDFKNFSFLGNEWENGKIKITTKNLGNFTILKDSLAPDIKPVQLNRHKVSFRINDDLSGIQTYEARLDGNWLLMHYDPKQRLIWSETKEPNIPVKGELLLEVKDNAGNVNQFKTQIN